MISNNKRLEWKYAHGIICNEDIKKVERILEINFPNDFIECVKQNNGGYPSLQIYDFNNHKEAVFEYLLSFDTSKQSYIVTVFNTVKDWLVESVYPFANDPFGNCICFDYRNKNKEGPSIVFWDHEIAAINSQKAIIPICESFTELLNKLYTY